MNVFEAELRPQPGEISALTDALSAFLDDGGVGVRAAHHVAMIVEELLTNVGTHGGAPDELAKVRVTIEPQRVIAEIEDKGSEFDPRAGTDPDISAPLEERTIGGLGVFLARKLSERLDYERREKTNHTKFAVKRA